MWGLSANKVQKMMKGPQTVYVIYEHPLIYYFWTTIQFDYQSIWSSLRKINFMMLQAGGGKAPQVRARFSLQVKFV